MTHNKGYFFVESKSAGLSNTPSIGVPSLLFQEITSRVASTNELVCSLMFVNCRGAKAFSSVTNTSFNEVGELAVKASRLPSRVNENEPAIKLSGLETRVTVLGHLQRGGSPTAFDRILGTKFGVEALQAASRGEFGTMVSLRGREVVTVKLEDAIRRQRLVSADSQIVFAARSVGISFGD